MLKGICKLVLRVNRSTLGQGEEVGELSGSVLLAALVGDLSDTYFPVEVIGLKNLQDGEVTWRCGRQEGLEPWCPETITRQILASSAECSGVSAYNPEG